MQRPVLAPAMKAIRAALVATVLAGCGGDRSGEPPPSVPHLFDPPSHWTDERGVRLSPLQWSGDRLVVSAFFTSCTTRCPRTIEKLRRLDEVLRGRGIAAQFVLVTLDPETDSPERLQRFKDDRRLPPSWHLVRGDREETRLLSRALRLRTIRDDGHIDHDVAIEVFDASGRLVRRFEGWDFDEREAASP